MIQDTFYQIKDEKNIVPLLKEAKEKAFNVNIEILDCKKSFARQSIDINFEKALEMYSQADFKHFVFISRNKPWLFVEKQEQKEYLEVGTRSNNKNEKVDYFIFLYIYTKYLEYFIEKYNLSVMN